MPSQTTKKDLLARLRTIEGHVRGIQRMVEDDAYCIDVIHQVKAIQQALERFNAVLLSEHLNTCVATAIRSDDPRERERVVSELLQVFGAAGEARSARRAWGRGAGRRPGRT
ncbi:MAG: transcriptional regulator [Chloroflexi bacterium]|jgi:DNA-binding FrmR family transcriptional regulator|uniref:Transcriptional regulator n=1 Tax=Candidatus Thermofonsia Clade 3 bacterium TaxID=2364212 RepID=A0A2M8QDT3_9CHLR|nr:metal-sensitive transcriptional regulator [Candidatus Roseilinea sp. NK_OTU-006]PJF47964.1 MAG: transcriptional regulator [Candidatus Thermofonsia Clade 3 bacterium]RMG65309.1 MAG: transcriptional regulator [Chloroflexota bacterium]